MMVGVKGNSYVRLIVSWLMITVLVMFCSISIARADESDQKGSSAKVMEAFEKQATQNKIDEPSAIQKKQRTMFFLGVSLLILLLVTGALGIAMGIYGKQVFMLHMVSAGLTITLAFVHAIVGVIWFYPF